MKLKNNIKKVILSFIVIIFFMTIITLSYFGVGLFEKGFNEFDYLMFNIVGSSILVGVTTYLSTKFISVKMSKMDYIRNNRVNIPINKVEPQIFNYNDFISFYKNSSNILNLSSETKELFERIFKKYLVWEFIKYNDENTSVEDTILNYPFIHSYLFNEDTDFIESWKSLSTINDSKKKGVKIFLELLDEKDFQDFKLFTDIIPKIQYFEITNLNYNNSFRGLITADSQVVSKIDLLPGEKKKLLFYFEQGKFIEYIVIYNNFDNKEEGKMVFGFRYENEKIKYPPAHINLKDYMDVN